MVAGEIGARTDGGDTAAPDGDGAVFEGPELVVQGDDGGAGDENVGRVAGAHFDVSGSGTLERTNSDAPGLADASPAAGRIQR